MKTLEWSLLVVLVTGVSVSTLMHLTRSPPPLDTYANEATAANEQNQAAEKTEAVVYETVPVAAVPVRQVAPTVPPIPDKIAVPVVEIPAQPVNVVRVRADQVLAKVNDQ